MISLDVHVGLNDDQSEIGERRYNNLSLADWWTSECDDEENRAEEDYTEEEKMSMADSAWDVIL